MSMPNVIGNLCSASAREVCSLDVLNPSSFVWACLNHIAIKARHTTSVVNDFVLDTEFSGPACW